MDNQSSLDRLHAAGIINAENFSEEDKQVVAQITPEEVDVLIGLRTRLGAVPEDRNQLSPNIGV